MENGARFVILRLQARALAIQSIQFHRQTAKLLSPLTFRRTISLLVLTSLRFAAPSQAAGFAPGDCVRLTKGETLLFKGEKFQPAGKGQEFTVLKHDAAQHLVFVSYLKEDASVVAVTLPDDALEPSPASAWNDLVRGAEAFRDQHSAEAQRLFQRARQDPAQQALAASLATATGAGPQAARALANQLAKAGMPGLALPLDQGAERLGAPAAAKSERDELTKRAAISKDEFLWARQAIGRRRLVEAARHLEAGLRAEPAHPEMKRLQEKAKRDTADAQELLETATRMRRFEKGAIHAMSAIDDGLKLCADHAGLRALRQEMAAQFEERTSPQITPAFLAAVKAKGSADALAEGRKLYTTRCTECHDLEMLDTRGIGGWDKAVGGMARRAILKGDEQARIMEYLGAALTAVEAGVGQ